ncbi:hypothetical protein CU102_10475 [Phyllobacterium brassicacearum]|uniref:Uncharacterized protein n=1 Tax=Phyllobacterium brassicacearum TaxID=314235 RepID=A0A2P7BRX6_9HYPH|nr:hypothetical protein CU102_10475 [Phyllobacterium brassicacearum]
MRLTGPDVIGCPVRNRLFIIIDAVRTDPDIIAGGLNQDAYRAVGGNGIVGVGWLRFVGKRQPAGIL